MKDSIPTTPRSSVIAGLLGIFLGGAGAHNWYLGQKQRGLTHVIILGSGIVVAIIGSILTAVAVASFLRNGALLAIGSVLTTLAGIAMSGNSIWGLVEGIMILVKGDAYLESQGYKIKVLYTVPEASKTSETKSEKTSEKSEKSDK